MFLIPTRSVVKNSNRWWQEANLLEQVGTLLLVTILIEDLVPVKSGLYSCTNNFPKELAVCHGKGVTLFLRQIIFFNSGALFAQVLLFLLKCCYTKTKVLVFTMVTQNKGKYHNWSSWAFCNTKKCVEGRINNQIIGVKGLAHNCLLSNWPFVI